jgi:hypothetical protein
MSVSQAAKTGDRSKILTALRDTLADAIDEASGRDLPPLAKQLISVIDDLEDSAPKEGRSEVDALSERRAERLRQAKTG